MSNPLLDVNARLVIAHRGNRIGAPENTMEALRQAVALGADGLEFDVRMTRDGVAVVFHDAALDRTTDGAGPLALLTFEEIRVLDAAARFAGRTQAHRVPSLEEALDEFRTLPLVIEVKEMAAVERTEEMVRRFGAQDRVIVGSARQDVMARLYRSGLATCASMRDAMMLIPVALMAIRPPRPRYDVLSLTPQFHGLPIPVRQMASAVRAHGIPTQVWTVNDPAQAVGLWKAGVNAIVTDDPAAILRTVPR